MIAWIHERCKHWGWQMRLLYLGKDGWPARSILGKLIEEGALGASSSRFMQHFPECLDADAIATNNAIKTLSEADREVLFLDYCVIGKAKVKAARMGVERRTYYDRRDAAHVRLSHALYLLANDPHKMTPKCAGHEYNELALSRA